MCGSTAGGPSLDGVDLAKAAVIQGVVVRDGAPAPGAYVRLLDAGGEFTAEVVSSATGQFRFFAAPGNWTIRVLAPGATADVAVTAVLGAAVEAEVALAA